MVGKMRNQVVYEANFDYGATYEKLVKSSIVVVDRTEKGLIWVFFKDTKTLFLLSPKGKIQVKWASLEEKKVLLKLLKNLLVPIEGQELSIKPSKQQVFIDYPPPPNFKLYWCEDETEYAKQAEFSPLLVEAVEKAVEKLRFELNFLREPTVKEVAVKVGKTPETVRPILYELAPKIEWREQSDKEAEKEAEEAINLAGWLSWLEKREENYELTKLAQEAMQAAPPQVIKRAKKILQTFPELVPEAKPSFSNNDYQSRIWTSAGINEWPQQTIITWKKVFNNEPPRSSTGTRMSFGLLKSF
ncbi:MAG: hypothetical protein QXI39_09890 [Candidatus Bathyarchaeia archaeon]